MAQCYLHDVENFKAMYKFLKLWTFLAIKYKSLYLWEFVVVLWQNVENKTQ